MSQILVNMEANPFPIALKPEEPYLKYLSCIAEHSPDVPKDLKKAVQNPNQWKALAKKLAKESPLARAFMGTTQVCVCKRWYATRLTIKPRLLMSSMPVSR